MSGFVDSLTNCIDQIKVTLQFGSIFDYQSKMIIMAIQCINGRNSFSLANEMALQGRPISYPLRHVEPQLLD